MPLEGCFCSTAFAFSGASGTPLPAKSSSPRVIVQSKLKILLAFNNFCGIIKLCEKEFQKDINYKSFKYFFRRMSCEI